MRCSKFQGLNSNERPLSIRCVQVYYQHSSNDLYCSTRPYLHLSNLIPETVDKVKTNWQFSEHSGGLNHPATILVTMVATISLFCWASQLFVRRGRGCSYESYMFQVSYNKKSSGRRRLSFSGQVSGKRDFIPYMSAFNLDCLQNSKQK